MATKLILTAHKFGWLAMIDNELHGDWVAYCKRNKINPDDKKLRKVYVGGYIDCHFRTVHAIADISKCLNEELKNNVADV